MKKTLLIAIALAAVFSLTTTASAGTYTVNMCGATAQAGFWEAAGAEVVKSTYGCSNAVLDWETGNQSNLVVRAQGCDIGRGTAPDTIFVRYNGTGSGDGCSNYTGGLRNYVNIATCTFPGGTGTCTAAANSAPCQMGCADVPCDTFKQFTSAPADGLGCHGTGGPNMPKFKNPTFYTPDTILYNGVIVPFGFIVNNHVTHHVCDDTNVNEYMEDAYTEYNPDNVHYAYDKDGWQCDPNETDGILGDGAWSCRSDYKCLDGVCQDGLQGTADEKTCSQAWECKETRMLPLCVKEEIKNVSLLQVCHIFSGRVDNWRDFGPGFPNLGVTTCQRLAGSGTQQTMQNSIMDLCGMQYIPTTVMHKSCHYDSSSNLARDCVGDYPGGIGYVDADKIMYRSGFDSDPDPAGRIDPDTGEVYVNKGAHQLLFNGHAPSRYDLTSGKYLFFSAQVCFMDPTSSGVGGAGTAVAQILADIQNTASDPQYLTFERFGQRAYFWATPGEMLVERVGGDPRLFPVNTDLVIPDRANWPWN